MDFLNYMAETFKAWDEPNPREPERMRPVANSKEGMYSLPEDMEMKAKLSTLSRRLDELEMRNQHEVRAVAEAPVHIEPCFICQSTDHQANAVGQYKPPTNAPYNNTYNPNWRNHPNLSWKPSPPAYLPPGARQHCGSSSQPQPPPSSSPVEQAILNLSKVVGNFVEEQKEVNVQLTQGVEEQKAANVQANQRINTMESTLNSIMDGLQNEMDRKFDTLQCSISRLTN